VALPARPPAPDNGAYDDTRAEVIRAKVGFLELAKQRGQACKMLGYSRDSFLSVQGALGQGGELALCLSSVIGEISCADI